jgi:hypothetical protein
MNPDRFNKIAESLRQYQRADSRDFEQQIANPVETLYVDPLSSDAVLKTTLSGRTTFLVGRKGTGKSTVFARAQAEIRKEHDLLSIYLDVKSLYDLIAANEVPIQMLEGSQLSEQILRSHLLRKHFIGSVVADIVSEVEKSARSLNLWQRWTGKQRQLNDVLDDLRKLSNKIANTELSEEELPVLRLMTAKTRSRDQMRREHKTDLSGEFKLGPLGPAGTLKGSNDDLEEALSDRETYAKYSDAILRSFPFASILGDIRELLQNAGIKRLVIFFDDFSEIGWLDQQLFVDVVLAPLNNSSFELIKLKIAAYPGRVYYGRIDPSKVDTLSLDFSVLYKSSDIQTAEQSAIEYTGRLLQRRFAAFGESFDDYLDGSLPSSDYMRLFFEATLNVPRLMGYLLHYLYLDRISKGLQITSASIRLAAQKYYEQVLAKYFDRMNRYALEPFEKKLDRHNQQVLLKTLVEEAKNVRRKISTGEVGGTYFAELTSPPVSHFAVSQSLEGVLASLELNFLVTKYHDMRNKDAQDVTIYALNYGLCESERLSWGAPRERRDDRSYFVQRTFDYTRTLRQFLANNKTIRCDNCGSCHGMDQSEKFEFFKWRCPDCNDGFCRVVDLSDDFKLEVQKLNEDIMLDPVELGILGTLNDETRPMRAGEISVLLDITHQLVGKRTEKLRDMHLVTKDWIDGANRSNITDKAKSIYFEEGA